MSDGPPTARGALIFASAALAVLVDLGASSPASRLPTSPPPASVPRASTLPAIEPASLAQRDDLDGYLRILTRFEQGEYDAAIAALAAWPSDEIARAVSGSAVDRMPISRQRAVAVLHAELLLSGVSPDALLPAATRAIARLSARQDEASLEFVIRWRVVAASCVLWLKGPIAAAGLLGSSQRRDPRLVLLEGSLHERQATEGWSGVTPLALQGQVSSRWRQSGAQQAQRRTALLAAEARFRTAIGASPDLVEARVRLGRVLAIQDRGREARAELERAFAQARHGVLKYMAALLLGGLDEREGRLDTARSWYQAALAEYADAQTAALALGHLLESQGQTEEGWSVIRRAFASSADSRTPSRDPWWVYHHAQIWQARALLDELREAVQP